MFFTQLYIQRQQKYLQVHKKTLNEKKFILIKKHLHMLDKAQNSKTFSNCQATYQKELILFAV